MGQSVNSASIIGKPVMIGNLLIAQNDFPKTMNWVDAGKACSALGKGWRLPTKTELNLLYKNRKRKGGFTDNYYWSSTEMENENKYKEFLYNAWSQNLYNGYSNYGDFSKDNSNNFRADRTIK